MIVRPRLSAIGLVATLMMFLGGCDDTGDEGASAVRHVFGRTGFGPGRFSYPRAAALSPDGHLYVVDKTARIQCFTPEGERIAGWHMPDSAAGKPTGLGIGPDGRVYVADTHYARVIVFAPDGEQLAAIGSRGDGPGQFIMPTDVAVASDGTIFVSEYGGNDRVSKFGPDWRYLTSFGGPATGEARLLRPQSLVIAGDNTLWVADACNHRICHFDADGTFLGAIGHSGAESGAMRYPYGLAVFSDGTLVVCEYGNNRLQRFNTAGRSLGVWGQAGRRRGQLAYPWAVEVSADDRMFVVDSGNNRVLVVQAMEVKAWQP